MDTRPDSLRRTAFLADAVTGYGHRSVGMTVMPSGKKGTALVADTALQKATGLSGVLLGGHDAMVFPSARATTAPMTMRGMNAPLDIAWLDETGGHIGNDTMNPGDRVVDPPGSYYHALELPAGGADRLGITDGSRVVFDDGAGNPAIGLPAADTLGPARVEPVQPPPAQANP